VERRAKSLERTAAPVGTVSGLRLFREVCGSTRLGIAEYVGLHGVGSCGHSGCRGRESHNLWRGTAHAAQPTPIPESRHRFRSQRKPSRPDPFGCTMKIRRHLTQRRLLVLGAVVVLYASFWFLTHLIGAPQIRNVAVEAMRVPAQGMIEPSGQRSPVISHCFTKTYAPFLVRADYGWGDGSLYGDGGSALYLWFFGRAIHVKELAHWAV